MTSRKDETLNETVNENTNDPEAATLGSLREQVITQAVLLKDQNERLNKLGEENDELKAAAAENDKRLQQVTFEAQSLGLRCQTLAEQREKAHNEMAALIDANKGASQEIENLRSTVARLEDQAAK